MKISLNWLKDYININQSPEEIGKLLTDTGLEVEGLENFEQVPGGLKGLVIGEVLTCEKHPNADKLSVTTVDIGTDAPSPIVCGAPNVAKGQKVVVATVGATLYPAGHEPFQIKKAKIRGEVSEGMICAEDEIGLGTSHEGIMVLDTDLPNGTPAAEYFNLKDDVIIEIGLTPNRADAASHIGVARDLKAVLKQDVQWPDVDNFEVNSTDHPIEVVVENLEACPRFSGVTITDVSVGESPDWLKQRLSAIGLTPINNVVDATNYVLHELGQPLHAYDASAVTGNKVIVKTLPKGTKFVTLDEKERTLTDHDLMICNGNEEGMCIGGVFGGIGSGVNESTKTIFLESAYFSPDYIRKTAQHHQLKTDASFRYERGTDPHITIYALKRAALLIQSLTGGKISSGIVDIYPEKIVSSEVKVKFKNIDRLIGKQIDKEQIFEILNLLDIEVSHETEEGFTASVPPYRVDVQREADVIEEILRIYGFNNVELPEHVQSDFLAEFPTRDKDKIQKTATELLVSNGYYEILTNSLTKPGYAELAEDLDAKHSVEILNKLSEDLGVLRQSMLYSGLEVALHNINRRQVNLRFFEFGKIYHQKEGDYQEHTRLAIFITGDIEGENWINKSRKVRFHNLSHMVNLILSRLLNKTFANEVIHEYPFDYGLHTLLNEKILVRMGKIKPAITKKMGLKQEIFYADIDWDLLLKKTNNNIVFEEVPKFPEVRRDLSLVIDRSVSFEDIKKIALNNEQRLLRSMNVFDVYEGENIGSDKKAYAISFILQDKEKTLTDKVIDKTMTKLMTSFESNLGALIRK
ncbi:Phenylalanyl-tRNA synthetase beta chain [Fulvivirga imtechensis AK7]|uniref:Phenylalanine--tRNA ligase beta subunit n=1 Tax=Fulvivirga imtechensis AK7 TaxID=1237149 RepID=L8JMK0_9BACT|nr:phenylalanine--tRNA ligase subunit beta [Fulvivirga imtechensis]ELR69458.1 Phenylalanyl-tRNA synthetase beta chain [Fulvivirga imtechensis AK7]